MPKINLLKYCENTQIYDIDGYYTNGDIMVLKEICEEIPVNKLSEKEATNINAVIDRATKYKNYKPADVVNDVKMVINPLYLELLQDLLEDSENKDFLAGKYSPVKITRNDKLVALIMPMQKPLTHQQENMLMINNFKEYCEYKDLIPVEYQLAGQGGINGFFFPRLASEEAIKKFIGVQVKHTGGRWLGKFERRPDLLGKYAEMIKGQLDKGDRSGILKRMTELDAKVKEKQA
jgi:hypothetical protein